MEFTMNSKTILFVVLSLIFGIFAVYLAQNWLESNTSKATTEQTGSVVTMATMVPMGTIIERKHLVLTSVPESIIPHGSVKKFDDAEGMVVNQKLYQGEILREERLNKKGEGSTLASLIQPKMRAVTIRVNDVVGVAGFLLPGNRVDVINLYKDGGYKTDVVLSNVKILAIDQRASNDENKPMLVRAVTLELSLEQAETLLVAKGRGSLQLALRNPNDSATVSIAQINKPQPSAMTEPLPAPEIASPPQPVEKVVYVQSPTKSKAKVLVLKGMKEQEVKLDN
jgi:pilus assembly protein CpaB